MSPRAMIDFCHAALPKGINPWWDAVARCFIDEFQGAV